MTDQAVAAPGSRAVNPLTGYLVLKLSAPDAAAEQWTVVTASEPARSAEAAIRNALAGLASGEQDGTFVAVPARSWRPVRAKPKVVASLTLEDATLEDAS